MGCKTTWRINMKNIISLLQDESGATAIEYGLIAALISVAAIFVMGQVGDGLNTTFTLVETELNAANTGGAGG